MKNSLWTKKLIWFNGALALFIIAWGAWVRLSGSGAGCGEHWPLCHGQVIPPSASMKTLIELTHRLTSGIFGITVLLQVFFAGKEFSKKHPQFKASALFLFLTIVEALIGAVLVKKGLVDKNDSALRAWVIGAHLVNTLLLMGVWSWCFALLKLAPAGRSLVLRAPLKKWETYLLPAAFLLFLITGAFGAIAALGNTLFPADSLWAGFQSDFDPQAPFLIQLRIYHPMLAILMSCLWIILLQNWKEFKELEKMANLGLTGLFIAVGFGALNWLLMAPVWGALGHLLIGDFLWLILLHNFWLRCYRPA